VLLNQNTVLMVLVLTVILYFSINFSSCWQYLDENLVQARSQSVSQVSPVCLHTWALNTKTKQHGKTKIGVSILRAVIINLCANFQHRRSFLHFR